MSEQIGSVIGWDNPISNEWAEENAGQGFKPEILDSGIYEFIIKQVVRKTVKPKRPAGKYDWNPMAEVIFEAGGCEVRNWLIMNTDFKQNIANFWDQLEGRKVFLEVEKFWDTYNGKQYEKNKFVRIIDLSTNPKQEIFEAQPDKPQMVPSVDTSIGGAVPPVNDDLPF